MEIIYDGKEGTIVKLLLALPKTKAIRRADKCIVIPTNGAKQVFKGDMLVINGSDVSVIAR